MSDTTLAFSTTLDGSGFASGMQNITGHLNTLGIQTNSATANLGGLGTILGTMANPATAAALALTTIGGALIGSAQSAAAWETSMSGVAKTTGLGGADLAELSDQLLTMSTNMPVAASGLAEIAQAGGSLGIAKEELAGFTEVAAQMGVGFEMSAEAAATAGAKILNAFGQEMNTENLRSLGSVVNTMGDSFAATEPQVLDFLNRASFLNTTMGQTIPQVAALGTTLISAGLEAEVAATGVKSMLNMLTSETSKTGGMDNWAKLMGTSVDELKEKVAGDLNGTLIETADKIAAIEDPVARFQAAVAAAGTEGAPALLKLAGQQENYQKALGMTNAEWEKASSLQKTFDAQSSTVNSQWTMFTNTISMAGKEVGTSLLPAISDTIGFMTDLAKIGMKVGETINDSVVKPMAELWAMGSNSSEPSGLGMAWGALKDWAGIGTEHAEQMAKEISESEKLQKAGAEAIQAGVDAGVLKDPAKNAAQDFSKEFVEAFRVAQADRDIARILADSGKVTAQDVDDSLRTFDYLGEQFALKIQSHTGAAIGDWFSYSLKAGDTVLAQSQASGNIDPLEAFTMATGLPAPTVGTEAYYRLLGDNIAAEKAKLKEQMKDAFDYSGISEPLKTRLENEGKIIGSQGSKTAQDAYSALLDDFRDPAVEKLGAVLDEINALAKERPLAASEYQLFGEEYKEKLLASITQMKPYLEDQMGDLAKKGTDAFSDHFFSDAEKSSLLGMKPWLEELKAKAPEDFAKAGGDSWLKFMDAIEKGASSSELEKMFADMGQKAGKGFAEAFGMNMNNALDSFDWSSLLQKMTPATTAGGQDFMKNSFQPDLIENATKQLALWDSGLTINRQRVEQNIQTYLRLAEVNPWLFTPDQLAAVRDFTAGLGDEGDMLDRIIKKTDSLKASTKKFAAETDEATACCGQLLSLFGAWQENTPELWKPNYMGPSYGGDFEEQMLANVAYTYLMTENNKRYGESIKGVTTERTAEIIAAEQILDDYHQGKMTLDDYNLGMKYFGAQVDITRKQAEEFATAIEGVNFAFDSGPVSYEKTISFRTDEFSQADINPTLGLDTEAAVNDFVAFKAAIEAEEIKVKLAYEKPETITPENAEQAGASSTSDRAALDRISANVLAVNTSLRAFNTQDIARLTQIDSSIKSFDSKTASNFSHEISTIGNVGATIVAGLGSNAVMISSAVYGGASMIVAAIQSSGGIGGGGASSDSGTTGSTGDYFDRMNGWPTLFASGGYADKPTLGIFGEAGPEYILPEQTLVDLLGAVGTASIRMNIDGSGLQSQLSSALDGMDIPALTIPARIDLQVDYSEVKDVLDKALKEVLAETRAR